MRHGVSIVAMPAVQPNMSAAEARVYVGTVVRRSRTSFYWAMRTLPEAKREAMFAVYAFCREVDDIADEPGTADGKRAALSGWRDEIENLYAGRPDHPVSCALVGPVAEFALRKVDFLAIIDGMEMDAREILRIADSGELARYCDRVACAVGRLSVRIFGVEANRGDAVADALGQALQLTNILRDLREDAERDRLYLPGDLLRAHGIVAADAGVVLAHPALPEVCRELAEMAQRRYDDAASALAVCDRRRMRPAIVMMEVYHEVLRRLTRRGWRRLAEPVGLSGAEKLWIAVRHGVV